MFCRLYVLIYFQILVLSPFKHSFCQNVCIPLYFLIRSLILDIQWASYLYFLSFQNLWCHKILQFLEGMLFFCCHCTFNIQYKIYRKTQSYPDSHEHISLQNVKFCRCIYLLYFFLFTISIPLVVNTFSMPMIHLTSP